MLEVLHGWERGRDLTLIVCGNQNMIEVLQAWRRGGDWAAPSGDQADALVLFPAKFQFSYLRRPRDVSEADGGGRHGY